MNLVHLKPVKQWDFRNNRVLFKEYEDVEGTNGMENLERVASIFWLEFLVMSGRMASHYPPDTHFSQQVKPVYDTFSPNDIMIFRGRRRP